MNIHPVTPEYDSSSQAVFNDVLVKADEQNFKLDQDNFLTTGSICLQNGDGDWFKIEVSSLTATAVGRIEDEDIVSGSGHVEDTYFNVALSGGSGSGAKATVLVDGGNNPYVGSVTITTGGTGYAVNDVLTIPYSIIGGTTNATCVVSTLSSAAPTLIITKLTGTQIDAAGRPVIASANPYV